MSLAHHSFCVSDDGGHILRNSNAIKAICLILSVIAVLCCLVSCNDEAKQTQNNGGEETNMNNTALTDTMTGYLVVPDSVARDGVTNVAQQLQELIDNNPNRTIFFPDGVYLISEPLQTSSDPSKTVSFVLSPYATIKADAERWLSNRAMICLGAKGNNGNGENIHSHTSFKGGVIDGSGITNGIYIESGIQTVIADTFITNVIVGIHIREGSNNGSADADISNVNIYGNGSAESVGVIVDAHDNTFTNMRIGKVHRGFVINRGANVLRNIHPLFYSTADINSSIAFEDNHGTNWYDFCYSDQFRTSFRLAGGARSFFRDCYVFYYGDEGDNHTVFSTDGAFNSVVDTLRVCFRDKSDNTMLAVGNDEGNGTLSNIYIDFEDKLSPEDAYKKYLK